MSDDRPQSMALADLLHRTREHLLRTADLLGDEDHLSRAIADDNEALADEIDSYLDSEYDLPDGSPSESVDITTDQRTPTGAEAALEAIDGVETAEWIDDLSILRVTFSEGIITGDVIDRVNDVRPVGASNIRLTGDGKNNAVVIYEYDDHSEH